MVLVSSELPELMGMSDRIIMLHAGRVGGAFTRDIATPERLLAAAMGHEPDAYAPAAISQATESGTQSMGNFR